MGVISKIIKMWNLSMDRTTEFQDSEKQEDAVRKMSAIYIGKCAIEEVGNC